MVDTCGTLFVVKKEGLRKWSSSFESGWKVTVELLDKPEIEAITAEQPNSEGVKQ